MRATLRNWAELFYMIITDPDLRDLEIFDFVFSKKSGLKTIEDIKKVIFGDNWEKLKSLGSFDIQVTWSYGIENAVVLSADLNNGKLVCFRIFMSVEEYGNACMDNECGDFIFVDGRETSRFAVLDIDCDVDDVMYIDFLDYSNCGDPSNKAEDLEQSDEDELFVSPEPMGVISWYKPDGICTEIRIMGAAGETAADVAEAIKSILLWSKQK